MKTILICLLILVPVVPGVKATAIVVEEICVKELTVEERIMVTLEQHKIPITMQRLILAQAKLESGEFTNRLTVQGNNLFGMRHPKIRRTTSLGPTMRAEGRTGYAKFSSIESSVEDLLLYLDARKIPLNLVDAESYAKILKAKAYYEDDCSDYARGLNRFLTNQ
jgi:uncharacterized FlgJ-related protein